MPLFDIPDRANKASDMNIAKKSKSTLKKSTTTVKGGSSLMNRISSIKALTEKALGQYKDEYIVIRDKETLEQYITACIENNIISIDTETEGLNPLDDKIVGICIYTPNQKPAYVPINHISYITNALVDNQLDIETVREQFERLIKAHVDIIMFNADFDVRVLRHQLGLKNIYCTWDCYLAARLMNENEPTNKLKPLHNKYVLHGKGDAFTFDDLFKGIKFSLIPINVAYLYAAHDAIVTYEYYEFQKKYIYYETDCKLSDRNGMNGVSYVFFNIEMPLVNVIADMEDAGVAFDFDYNEVLKVKYHALLDEREDAFHDVCAVYAKEIEAYKLKHVDCKLDEPINIKSPEQLAILFYDVLGYELFYDKAKRKYTRSTAEEQLQKLNTDLTNAVLNYREFSTLVDTFIDKLPTCVRNADKRIHCKFNQYGAKTGRFSSSEPNLQNIPSHNKDIRKMFVASNTTTEVIEHDNCFAVDKFSEINTTDGWKYAENIKVGDKLLVTEDGKQLEIIVTKLDILVDKSQIVYYY